MNSLASPTVPSTTSDETRTAGESACTASEIDASCRWPLLTLFVGAVIWLVLNSVLGLITSIKLHAPGFLADCSWLSYGRVSPAQTNALMFGFASQAAI